MTQEVAYRFIEALNALEQDGEIDPIVATFSEYCEIGTPVNPHKLHGRAQAREFWSNYRTAHRRIHSRFRNIVIGENSIALEWTARGTHRSGREFQYDGVSMLEIAGSRITHFRTYFDSRAVQEQAPLSAAATF
jgi:ketosteroid isomerase-like protein